MRKALFILAVWMTSVAAVRANGGENFSFHPGEKLTYRIFWGPFAAGKATLEVKTIEQVDGHDCYRLIANATTTGLIDLLFHVDSTIESWMDTEKLFSRRCRENRVEGDRTYRNEFIYRYNQQQTIVTNLLRHTAVTFPLAEHVQDIVSAVYFIRTQPLQLNKPNEVLVNTGDTNRLVRLLPDQRKTIWTRPLGDNPALRVEPKPTLTVISHNKGRMWVWLSDDTLHIPLLLYAPVRLGTARFVLQNIETTNPVLLRRIRARAEANNN